MAKAKPKKEPLAKPLVEPYDPQKPYHLEFFFQNAPFYDHMLRIWLVAHSQMGNVTHRAIVTNLELQAIKDGDPLPTNPTLQIHPLEATGLMDKLWAMGIRPSDQASPGQLKAMQDHLGDLRKIIFKQLGLS